MWLIDRLIDCVYGMTYIEKEWDDESVSVGSNEIHTGVFRREEWGDDSNDNDNDTGGGGGISSIISCLSMYIYLVIWCDEK